MIQRRYHITLAASTSAGGKVTTASSLISISGARIALEGDEVFCPACNAKGVIKLDGPRLNERFNGRQVALSDDLCICNCNPAPKLIADQTLRCQVLVLADAEEPAQQAGAMAARAAAIPVYDEQPQLITPPIEGVPYFIETLDGRTFSGRAGPGGLLPRVTTEGEGEYHVYWGDEALYRTQGVAA